MNRNCSQYVKFIVHSGIHQKYLHLQKSGGFAQIIIQLFTWSNQCV